MPRQPSAILDRPNNPGGESMSNMTRQTEGLQPQVSQDLPQPPEQCTMSGADLLIMLQKSGTGANRLRLGVEVLQKNRSASAKEVYDAIDAAGWGIQIRPYPGFVQGVVSRENKYAATLAKARRFMAGCTLEQFAIEAKQADANQSGGMIVTEAEIKAAGLSGTEYLQYLKDQDELHNQLPK